MKRLIAGSLMLGLILGTSVLLSGYAYAQYGSEYYPPYDQYGNPLCGYDNQGYPVYCNNDYGDGYNYYGYGPYWGGDEEHHWGERRGHEREWGEHHERGEHHEGGERHQGHEHH